jgi:2-amino-4-hydroxy-6-hydroxymethyldihydropteridine diphosphokinase
VSIAYVGLGSNLDAPQRQVTQALRELSGIPRTRLVRRSSLYRSAPLGYTAQPEFVNAVAALDTALSPEELLTELQAIEARHGRLRSFPDAPRTLDLDLLLYGGEVRDSVQLTVPHPRMHERAFVLKPLLELAPEISIPGRGPAEAFLAACTGQQVEKAVE